MKLKALAPWKESFLEGPKQHIQKQRHHFADKGSYSQSYCFSSSHVRIWQLDQKEGWLPENWCFQTVVLEKTLESPLDCKQIQPVHPKGNQSWIFIERTDAEAETPILWPPDVKNRLIGKDPDAGKVWRQEKKGTTEDEMVGWHHPIMDMSFANSRRQWRTGKPGALQSMGLERAGDKLLTEQQTAAIMKSQQSTFAQLVFLQLRFKKALYILSNSP